MKYKIIGENRKEDFLLEIFKNRDFPIDEIFHYLNTTDKDIENYNHLDNIDKAIDKLDEHLKKESRILIVVDCDVDGFTSASILYNFLKDIKPNIKLSYVLHEGKQHGLSSDLYEDIYGNYDLIFLPDGGTNDYEQHAKLKTLGTDIIVLDHHEAPSYSKDAIIVNNQLSKNYNNKNLSGAGIVWHFIEGFTKEKELSVDINKYLDLVALGNVSDIMDLRSIETKHLVMKGLTKVNNPFFSKAVELQAYSLKDGVTPEGVAWYIGPYMNAMIRVGEREDKELLFKSMLEENRGKLVKSTKRGAGPDDTETLTGQAFRLCSNVKEKQKRIVDKGIEYIENLIKNKGLDKNKILSIVIPQDEIMPEVVGLVANMIAGKYQQPTLILRDTKNGYVGSGRNFNYSPLEDFKGYLKSLDLFFLAEGHASAFGVGISKANFEKFITISNRELANMDFSPMPLVDFEFDLSDNKEVEKLKKLITTINSLNTQGFWGQGIKEPLIAIKNIEVDKIDTYKKKRVTKKITDINNFQYMDFNSTEEKFSELEPQPFKRSFMTVVGKANLNIFYNRTTYQIFIENYEKIIYNNIVNKWNF